MRSSYLLSPREEAEKCRRQAMAYAGKPEAPFLLRVAEAFENLDAPNVHAVSVSSLDTSSSGHASAEQLG